MSEPTQTPAADDSDPIQEGSITIPDNGTLLVDGPFDPAEHTIAQVEAHLAEQHPDEVARVLAAEETGKARAGLLEGPYAAQVQATEPATVEELLGDDDPYELVRGKDAAGNEYTATRVAVLSAGSTVLDKPALDGFGRRIPTKTVLDFRAEANAAGDASTEPTKEN